GSRNAKLVLDKRKIDAGMPIPAGAAAVTDGKDTAADVAGSCTQIRLLQNVLDQPTHRAGAIQRALRAAQDLDALQVIRHQSHLRQGRCGEVAAGTHGRIVNTGPDYRALLERRNATNHNRCLSRRTTAADLHAWQLAGEINQRGDVLILQQLAVDHAYRRRHLADILRA